MMKHVNLNERNTIGAEMFADVDDYNYLKEKVHEDTVNAEDLDTFHFHTLERVGPLSLLFLELFYVYVRRTGAEGADIDLSNVTYFRSH